MSSQYLNGTGWYEMVSSHAATWFAVEAGTTPVLHVSIKMYQAPAPYNTVAD